MVCINIESVRNWSLLITPCVQYLRSWCRMPLWILKNVNHCLTPHPAASDLPDVRSLSCVGNKRTSPIHILKSALRQADFDEDLFQRVEPAPVMSLSRLKSDIPAIHWGPENVGLSKTRTTTQAAAARAHTQSTLEDISIGQPIIFTDGWDLGNQAPAGLPQSASRKALSLNQLCVIFQCQSVAPVIMESYVPLDLPHPSR